MAVITITSAGTYDVHPGDTFIIGPGVEGDVTFEAAHGVSTPVDFNIELNEDPTHDKDIKIAIKGHDELHPNISIADGYTGHNTELDLKDAAGSEITTGNDVIIGKLEASENGKDITNVGTLDRDELAKLGKLEFDGNGGHDKVIPADAITIDLSWMTDAEKTAFEETVLDAGYQSDGSGGFFAPDPDGDGKSDVEHVDFKMDLDGDGHDDFELKLHHYEEINFSSGGVAPADLNGIVEGDNTANKIDTAYTGDPEGDMIDANDAPDGSNDDVVDAGGGDDTILSGEGDDTVYAGSGNDSVEGGDGDDVIFGDSNYPGGKFDGGATVRESFEWDKAPDPNGSSPIEDGDPLSEFTQNTGNVEVTFKVTAESNPNIVHEFSDEEQFVGGIDDGSESIDDESGLLSNLTGKHASASYELGFSTPVENADFRINDIDGSSKVTVRAFDAAGNEIAVTLTAGSELKTIDTNTVETKDPGEYEDVDDADYSVRVEIDGPVSKITIDHGEGDFNSGIWVTDIYYDVPVADTGAAGDDTLLGGDGDDMIYGEGGDDSIEGGAGADLLSGGEGTNTLRGGDGDDTFVGGPGADSFEGGRDEDVIDYSGSGAAVNVDLSTSSLSGGDANNDTIISGIDGVIGSDFDDTLIGFDQQGTSSSDVFSNFFDGGAGDDTIDGRGGDDVLIGGDGNDSILGGDGNDHISGGNGDDTLLGGAGNDQITGGPGNDFIDGGDGNDQLEGGSGDDTIVAASGNNVSRGGDDADTFKGFDNNANNVVFGGAGGNDDDTLDLTGTAGDGTLKVEIIRPDSDGNGHDGIVRYFDGDGRKTGEVVFENIENIIPCFTPGTRIATPRGEVAVEDLREGDRVITRDNGLQEVRWVGERTLGAADLATAPHLQPVLIRAGALGHGLPERDMLVSPQHRVLLTSERASLYFGEREVLAAAKHLTGMEGIDDMRATEATYIHFMCDRHEVVLSDGAWTESFQPGEQVLDGMGDASREEIYALFPELRDTKGIETYQAARRSLKRHETRLLVE